MVARKSSQAVRRTVEVPSSEDESMRVVASGMRFRSHPRLRSAQKRVRAIPEVVIEIQAGRLSRQSSTSTSQSTLLAESPAARRIGAIPATPAAAIASGLRQTDKSSTSAAKIAARSPPTAAEVLQAALAEREQRLPGDDCDVPRVETDSSGDDEQKAWNASREERFFLKRRVRAVREAFPAVLHEFRPLLRKAGIKDEAYLREVVNANLVDRFVQDLRASFPEELEKNMAFRFHLTETLRTLLAVPAREG